MGPEESQGTLKSKEGGRRARIRSCDDRNRVTEKEVRRCYAAGFENEGRGHKPWDADGL